MDQKTYQYVITTIAAVLGVAVTYLFNSGFNLLMPNREPIIDFLASIVFVAIIIAILAYFIGKHG